MTTIKILSLTAVVVMAAGVVASVVIERGLQAKLHQREALAQDQNEKITSLTAENQRLSNQLAGLRDRHPGDYSGELTRLGTEITGLRDKTNSLAQQLEQRRQKLFLPFTPVEHPPEYYREHNQEIAGWIGQKGTDARNIATAFSVYAEDHQGQSPSNFDQINDSLAKMGFTVSGTNEFDIVFTGNLDDLKGIQYNSVAIIRDRQTFTYSDGTQTRFYGMLGGIGQQVGSGDNFQSFEAQHVISPPTGQ